MMRTSLLILLLTALFISGCNSGPKAPLNERLSDYSEASQQCEDFLSGKEELNSDVEKGCKSFVERLDKTNELAVELDDPKLSKAQIKQKKTTYSRQKLKLRQSYETLSNDVKSATNRAMRSDDVKNFSLGVNFPGNRFEAAYYKYMKSKSPRFDNDQNFLEYQKHESQKLIEKAQREVDRGNYDKAQQLFEKASKLQNGEAAYKAGYLSEGKDNKHALELHLLAAQLGEPRAYLHAGQLYELEGNREEALKYYNKAALNGDKEANYRLWNFYKNTTPKKARVYLEDAVKDGSLNANYDLAMLLIEEDQKAQALKLLQAASAKSHQASKLYLGKYYIKFNLFSKAQRELQGARSAEAFWLRGQMAEKGQGQDQDLELAYSLYVESFELGNRDAGKDIQRIKSKQSKEQQAQAAIEEATRLEQMKQVIKECGALADEKNILKAGTKIHLTGVASMPLLGARNFLIYGDDGREYYVEGTTGVQADAHVNIAVSALAKPITIVNADDESNDILRFKFIKKCEIR